MKRFKFSVKRYNIKMGILALLLAALPMFFYKLGASSLVSWDEAWYGEIAKQILHTHSWFVLHFNDLVFMDHPPAGFWLIAIGQHLFGINEFGTRAMSAVSGIAALYGVYLLGKTWYGKIAGWCSAFALLSAPWFLYRARTGNLDVFLTMFFVYTIYFAWKARSDRKYFVVFLVTLLLLLLTKTMVPFTVFPALIVIFWGGKKYRWWEMILGMGLVAAVVGYWAKVNITANEIFLKRYLSIGLPGVGGGQKIDWKANLKQTKDYFYFGIGKWFWWGMMGMVAGFMTRKRHYIVPVVAALCILVPFALSSRGQIWHMIPAYPFVLLVLFGVATGIARRVGRAGYVAVIVFALVIGLPLVNRNWTEFVDKETYVSDEAILAKKASLYAEPLYLDDDSFPAVRFYSDKHIEKVFETIDMQVTKVQGPFLMISRDWRITGSSLKPEEYEILARDRDKWLVRVLQ